jgi:hypothetical protein
MPSITGNIGMTGMTGPSLPWLLSDMSTQISPIGLNGGRFLLNSRHRPPLSLPAVELAVANTAHEHSPLMNVKF